MLNICLHFHFQEKVVFLRQTWKRDFIWLHHFLRQTFVTQHVKKIFMPENETKIVRCMKAALSQKKKSCKNIFTTWTLFICGFTKVWSRAHQPFVNPQINILILKMWPNVGDFISITWLFCSVQTKLTNQKNSHAKKQIYKILSFWGKSFFFSLNKPYSYNSNFYQKGFLQDFTLETKLDFFNVN